MIARVRQKHEAGRPRAFAVALKESDQLIGGGIDGINIGGSDAAELGYWLGEPYWGRGYGREAAAAIIEYGFEVLGLETIQAISDPSNAASKKVLLACGLKRAGEFDLIKPTRNGALRVPCDIAFRDVRNEDGSRSDSNEPKR
jgi:ribosomal-protein-alanine N-acetyltransferase